MSFEQPWWILALVAVPVMWFIHRRGHGAVSARQRIYALLVRSIVVACVVLSAAGAAIRLPDERLTTIFVLDVSDSVPPASRDRAERFIQSALDAKPPDALAGIVVFGGDARVETALQQDARLFGITSEADASSTDIARALRLAAALLPNGARRRIVLLSDGRENSGDVRTEARSLEEEGITVDVIGFSGAPLDAAVTEVDAPTRVRAGERFDIEATVATTGPMDVHVTVRRDEKVIAEEDLSALDGEQRLTFPDEASNEGSVTYRVDISNDRDGTPQNDSSASLVLVSGRPRVAIVEGAPDEGKVLERALNGRGLVVSRMHVPAFPSAQELAATDAVVLVDVEGNGLTDSQIDALTGFVRDGGRGLVAVGGESSWSLGGYRNTALEDLLPLNSDIKDPRRRPSVAEVLAMDTSGSMGACHCEDPNAPPSMSRGGINKTDITRSAAARAVEVLTNEDELGLLAFNTQSRWVVPLQRLPSQAAVTEGLQQLRPSGGTSIPQALDAAAEALQASNAALKHIIVFTDGWTDQSNLDEAAAEVKAQGITVSVLATGEGPGDELAKMAEAGGGRFYAGRNLYEIPEIMMSEVVLAARRYVNEGLFYPQIAGNSAATERLVATPPLLGYVATSPKPSASVLLSIGKEEDPLLARWRKGLGVVSAWTSDAKGRWARRWVGWKGFADFWSNVVRETLPAAPNPGYSSRVTSSGTGLDVTVDAEEAIPEGAEVTVRAVGPDGTTTRTELSRAAADSFSGSVEAAEPGAYLISTEIRAQDRSLYRDTVGAVRTYSPEYRPGAADTELLEAVATVTGGRPDIAPAAAFDPDLEAGSEQVDIRDRLLVVALLLLVVDIALRRLILTREDVHAVTAWRPSGSRAPTPRTERMRGLLRAKYRVRQVDDAAGSQTGSPVAPTPAPTPPARPVVPPSLPSTDAATQGTDAGSSEGGVSELLRRKRERGNKD